MPLSGAVEGAVQSFSYLKQQQLDGLVAFMLHFDESTTESFDPMMAVLLHDVYTQPW